MDRTWKTADLAAALRARAEAGKVVRLSPSTARLIAGLIDQSQRPRDLSDINHFSEGSAVFRLDHRGEIAEIVAFARSALAAKAAFEYLCENYPNESYMQKRRAWVEGLRIVEKPASRD